MSKIDSSPHFSRIILYRDKFGLSNHPDISSFITALDREKFSPYVLLINKTDPINHYQLEFDYIPQTGMDNPFLGEWMFLDICSLSFSEETKQITLEASTSMLWLILQILFWGGMIALVGYSFLISGYKLLLLFSCLVALPPIMIYRRDVHRLKRIRSFAGKQE